MGGARSACRGRSASPWDASSAEVRIRGAVHRKELIRAPTPTDAPLIFEPSDSRTRRGATDNATRSTPFHPRKVIRRQERKHPRSCKKAKADAQGKAEGDL